MLYISPLKALGVDVERNLRSLSASPRRRSGMGLAPPAITASACARATPPRPSADWLREPPDILITTPESLYLMLTSAARETLAGVETVIVDEIHAVAATKRGAHLALSLERLDALLPTRPRSGSGCRPRCARSTRWRFLGGREGVEIVAPPIQKTFELRVVVPVEDMTELGARTTGCRARRRREGPGLGRLDLGRTSTARSWRRCCGTARPSCSRTRGSRSGSRRR